MQSRRITRTKVVGLAEGAVIGVFLIGAVVVGTTLNTPSDRGMKAWTMRLDGQADAYRQERAADAYAARLSGVAQQRADAAWAARLDGIAREAGAYDRAMDAWTRRLTGLAEHLAGE